MLLLDEYLVPSLHGGPSLVEGEGESIDLAVVGIELIKLDGLGVIDINGIKDRDDVILREGGVQSCNHIPEAFERKIAHALLVIGLEGLLEGYLLVVEYSEQPLEATFRLLS